jgi:N utilization substance protein A
MFHVSCFMIKNNMTELTNAIKQICDEKNLSYDAVLATIESALSAAYRKDFGKKNQNIIVEFNPETTKSKIYDLKEVVEDLPEIDEEEEEPTVETLRQAQGKLEDSTKKDDKKKDPSASSGQAKKKRKTRLR